MAVVNGTNGADTLVGTAGDDQIYGAGGDDILSGGAGNDYIDAGSSGFPGSHDILNGQDGDDYMLIYPADGSRTDPFSVADGGSGFDTVELRFSNFGSALTYTHNATFAEVHCGRIAAQLANVERIVFFAGFASDQITGGSANDEIYGGGGDDQLAGAAGDDILSGGAGTDTLSGQDGNDLLIVGSDGNDVLDGGAGMDAIVFNFDWQYSAGATFSLALGSQVLNGRTITTTSIENIIGSVYADTLTGSAGDNVLAGVAGDDVLNGGAGNDILEGGTGNDRLDGGAGIDTATYQNATGAVTVDLSRTVAQAIGANQGTDTLIGIENLIGSAYNDVLKGDDQANTLTGGAGNDILTGGAGDDILDGGTGIDTAVYGVARSQVSISRAGDGTLTVSSAATGTDKLTSIEHFQFTDGLYSFRFAAAGSPLVSNFAVGAGGWTSQDAYPRHIADVNGDGYADIVGFGHAGVLVSYGSASGSFSSPAQVVANFGQTSGWASDNLFHRELADVNGDGRADIIGFGIAGTLVSLARANGTYADPTLGVTNFGSNQGWATQDGFARAVGDINGDGKADLIGFGYAGTLVSLGKGDGTFGNATLAINNFGVQQGWTSDNSYHRAVADVNGDGKADLIGFGQAGTYVALSKGDGTFSEATLALDNFGKGQGWSTQDSFDRQVADVNGDGRADVVGFGIAGTYIAYGRADGSFSAAQMDIDDFAANQGWTSDTVTHREIADINHDGLKDIVGFGFSGVLAGLNQGHDFLIL